MSINWFAFCCVPISYTFPYFACFCFYCLCSSIFVEKYESNLRPKHHFHDEYFVSLIGRCLLFKESGIDELANTIYSLLGGIYRVFIKKLKYTITDHQWDVINKHCIRIVSYLDYNEKMIELWFEFAKLTKMKQDIKIGIEILDPIIEITYKNYDGVEIDVSTDISDAFDPLPVKIFDSMHCQWPRSNLEHPLACTMKKKQKTRTRPKETMIVTTVTTIIMAVRIVNKKKQNISHSK